MQDFVALFGRLAGTMINPLVWGVSLAVSIVLRDKSFWLRLIVCIGAVGLLGLVLYSLTPDMSFGEKSRGLILAVIGAAIWLLLFAGIARLRR